MSEWAEVQISLKFYVRLSIHKNTVNCNTFQVTDFAGHRCQLKRQKFALHTIIELEKFIKYNQLHIDRENWLKLATSVSAQITTPIPPVFFIKVRDSQ